MMGVLEVCSNGLSSTVIEMVFHHKSEIFDFITIVVLKKIKDAISTICISLFGYVFVYIDS